MRVLLLHEYSGVHTELQKGLRANGVVAITANIGDSYRAFESDLRMGSNARTVRGTLSRAVASIRNASRMRQFDIVQSIVPRPFGRLTGWIMEPAVLEGEGRAFVYLAAGSDAIYQKHIRTLDYWPPHNSSNNVRRYRAERATISRAKRIVAGAWDYQYSFKEDGFSPCLIPFPVMTSDYEFQEVAKRRKIRVYHPLNRMAGPDFKGTALIMNAFERLRKRFGSDVEFVAAGKMPFHEYIKFVSDVDVIVDQVYSHAYGMSAVFGMAQGKVVLSGLEAPVSSDPAYMGSPVINLKPDVDAIETTIEQVLQSRQRLGEIGYASRRFAEARHDAVVVAEKYIQVYRDAIGD